MLSYDDLFNFSEKAQLITAHDIINFKDDLHGWFVISGQLNLFAQHKGRRKQLLSLNANQLFFSLSDEESKHSLMAVASKESKIIALSVNELIQLAQCSSAHNASIAYLIEEWVEKLAHFFKESFYPNDVTAIKYQEQVSFKREINYASLTATAWILNSTFLKSINGFELDNNAQLHALPLTKNGWINLTADNTTQLIATPEWLKTPHCQYSLRAYHRYCLQHFEQLLSQDQQNESVQLEKIAVRSKLDFQSSLHRLSLLIDKNINLDKPVSPHPMVAAIQAVTMYLQCPIELDKLQFDQNRIAEESFDKILASVQLKTRKIRLRNNWWEHSDEPLLVFFGKEKKPAALIPSSARSYKLLILNESYEVTVNETIAAEIDQSAWLIIKPLPENEKITPKKMLSFSLLGSNSDIKLMLTLMLLVSLLSGLTPIVSAWVLDPIIPAALVNELLVATFTLFFVGFIIAALGGVQAIAILRLEGRMTNTLQAAVWDRVLKLPINFFKHYSIGDLANRIEGIDKIRNQLTASITQSLLHSTMGLFSFILMLYYNWKLALVVLSFIFLYFAITFFIALKVMSKNEELLFLKGKLHGTLYQILRQVKKLKTTASERYGFSRWAEQYSQLIHVQFQQMSLNNSATALKSSFQYLSLFIIILIIAWEGQGLWAYFSPAENIQAINNPYLKNVMQASHFVAFHIAFLQLAAAVFGLSQSFLKLTTIKPLYQRIKPLLDSDLEDKESLEHIKNIQGRIEISDLSFSYHHNDKLVLNNLNIKVNPGEFIAIVGSSGAGKSTLIRLLLGFEQANSGSIYYDNKPLKKIYKHELRQFLGVVLQNSRMLSGSIYHNICAGYTATLDEAWQAAKMVCLDNDINQMPMGMNTFINEGATTLSGGQRQRIMIARAIIRKPRILIFDEATSALDNKTQAVVTQSIKTLKCSRIVVAHRLSTIINADTIYVLDNGSVVESGNYQTLMAQAGLFKSLVSRQII